MEDHQFNPHQPQEKKKELFVQYGCIYMGVYILVSTQKVKRRDFNFYKILIFLKSCNFKILKHYKFFKIFKFFEKTPFRIFSLLR